MSVNMSTMCPWMKILHGACCVLCAVWESLYTGQSSRHYRCAPEAVMTKKCCYTVSWMQSDFKYETMAKVQLQKKAARLYNGEFLILNQIKRNPDKNNRMSRWQWKKRRQRMDWKTDNGLYQSLAVLWFAWNRKCENYTRVSRT